MDGTMKINSWNGGVSVKDNFIHGSKYYTPLLEQLKLFLYFKNEINNVFTVFAHQFFRVSISLG